MESGELPLADSVTVKEFKKMLITADSRADKIMENCIEKLIIQGIISQEGL